MSILDPTYNPTLPKITDFYTIGVETHDITPEDFKDLVKYLEDRGEKLITNRTTRDGMFAGYFGRLVSVHEVGSGTDCGVIKRISDQFVPILSAVWDCPAQLITTEFSFTTKYPHDVNKLYFKEIIFRGSISRHDTYAKELTIKFTPK